MMARVAFSVTLLLAFLVALWSGSRVVFAVAHIYAVQQLPARTWLLLLPSFVAAWGAVDGYFHRERRSSLFGLVAWLIFTGSWIVMWVACWQQHGFWRAAGVGAAAMFAWAIASGVTGGVRRAVDERRLAVQDSVGGDHVQE